MPASARRAVTALTTALVSTAAAVAIATPASAAEAVAPNACKYSIDGYWRSLDLRLAAAADPVYVPPGAGFRLGRTAIAATFPDWISEYGFNLGHLSAGLNRIPSEVWIAVAARGTAQGVQVLKASVTAETTVTTSPDGEQFRGATPLQVTVPLPDSVWTAPAGAGERISFEQAPPGTLPAIPGRNGGTATVPQGSIFIRSALTNNTIFDLDCQPGRGSTDGNSFSGQASAPFELAYTDPNAAETGITAPVVASPPVTVGAGALRTNAKRTSVPVTLRNAGLIDATGQIRIRTATKQRTTKTGRKRILTVSGWKAYRVGARRSQAVSLKLSADLRKLLKTTKQLKVRVGVRAATGEKTAAGAPKYGKETVTTVSLRRR